MVVIHGQIFIIIFHKKLIFNLFPYSIVMSPKMHNKHAFSPGRTTTVDMNEIISCFITGSHI